MSQLLTPRMAEMCWVIELPTEMAQALGVAEGSLVELQVVDGRIETEILSPPSPAFVKRVQSILEKRKEAFEEMKRLGD